MFFHPCDQVFRPSSCSRQLTFALNPHFFLSSRLKSLNVYFAPFIPSVRVLFHFIRVINKTHKVEQVRERTETHENPQRISLVFCISLASSPIPSGDQEEESASRSSVS